MSNPNYGTTADDYRNSDFFVKKMTAIFNGYDATKDGILSMADYDELAKRMISIQTDDKNTEMILKTCKEMFLLVACAGKPDSEEAKITLPELIENCAVAMDEKNRDETVRVITETYTAFFDMVDTSHNGLISYDEYRKFHEVFFQEGRVTEEFSKHSFDTIDTNKNGQISLEEFTKAAIDYNLEITGDESTAALIYGPLS